MSHEIIHRRLRTVVLDVKRYDAGQTNIGDRKIDQSEGGSQASTDRFESRSYDVGGHLHQAQFVDVHPKIDEDVTFLVGYQFYGDRNVVFPLRDSNLIYKFEETLRNQMH